MAPRHIRASLCALAASFAFAAPADAKLSPVELTASFADRPLQKTTPAKPIPVVCTISFSVADERRSPDLVGVVGKRAVKAPADSTAWLKAVLAGFTIRGIALGVLGEETARPAARLVLQTAWIDEGVGNYNASVVIALHYQPGASAPIDHVYRGRATRTLIWSNGTDTLQSAMDGAFADALTQMAADLRPLCSS